MRVTGQLVDLTSDSHNDTVDVYTDVLQLGYLQRPSQETRAETKRFYRR
jgi:hypothetical protein